MADLFLLANQLSILLAARKPQWTRQPVTLANDSASPLIQSTPRPSGTSDGRNLENTTTSLLAIDLREDPSKRTCRITFGSIDLTGTYRVVVDGVTVNHVAAAADLNALIVAWRDALNADGAINTIVTAFAEDSSGSGGDADTLVIRGDAVADYSLAIDTPAGTGILNGSFDASTGTARAYFTHRSTNNTAIDPVALWHASNNATWTLTNENFVERLDVAGLERGFIELTAIKGQASDAAVTTTNANTLTYAVGVTWGPAVQETS